MKDCADNNKNIAANRILLVSSNEEIVTSLKSIFDELELYLHVSDDWYNLDENEFDCVFIDFNKKEIFKNNENVHIPLFLISDDAGAGGRDLPSGFAAALSPEELTCREVKRLHTISLMLKKCFTERAELERQFIHSQRLSDIGQLAAGIAHDFNNLISIILKYAEFLAEEFEEGSSQREDIEEIRSAGMRAAAIARQLLLFSRKQVESPQKVDINSIIQENCELIKRALNKNIRFDTSLGENLPEVKIDPRLFAQVLLNLAINARDAMPSGGTLTIETRVVNLDEEGVKPYPPMKPGTYVMVEVGDTGCGMSREVSKHVFEPFFTTKEEGKGTGLGLSTVYGIIKRAGGNIWVHSEPGVGTTFKIFLPPAERRKVERRPPQNVVSAREAKTILVIEDDEVLANVLSRVLQKSGYVVLTASDGKEALEVAKRCEDKISLVLADVVLPGENAVDITEKIKELHPNAKVIMMSGYAVPIVIHHGMLKGNEPFLQKPFSKDELLCNVRKFIN